MFVSEVCLAGHCPTRQQNKDTKEKGKCFRQICLRLRMPFVAVAVSCGPVCEFSLLFSQLSKRIKKQEVKHTCWDGVLELFPKGNNSDWRTRAWPQRPCHSLPLLRHCLWRGGVRSEGWHIREGRHWGGGWYTPKVIFMLKPCLFQTHPPRYVSKRVGKKQFPWILKGANQLSIVIHSWMIDAVLILYAPKMNRLFCEIWSRSWWRSRHRDDTGQKRSDAASQRHPRSGTWEEVRCARMKRSPQATKRFFTTFKTTCIASGQSLWPTSFQQWNSVNQVFLFFFFLSLRFSREWRYAERCKPRRPHAKQFYRHDQICRSEWYLHPSDLVIVDQTSRFLQFNTSKQSKRAVIALCSAQATANQNQLLQVPATCAEHQTTLCCTICGNDLFPTPTKSPPLCLRHISQLTI